MQGPRQTVSCCCKLDYGAPSSVAPSCARALGNACLCCRTLVQDILVVVVDTSPAVWRDMAAATDPSRALPSTAPATGTVVEPPATPFGLPDLQGTLTLLLRSHLLLHWGNKVALLTFDGGHRLCMQ